jgi:Plasmid pRiA4b ORF-3-like protein.
MILKFRALSGENEGFARDYEISEKSTLLDLHSLIQHDLGYDPSQMASFFTVDQDWAKLREFTLFDMGETNDDKMLAPISMEAVPLESIVHERNQRLLYNFDLFNDRGLFLEMLERKDPEVGVDYPAVSFSLGDAPFQIEMPGDENAYEDMMSDFNDFESYEDYDQRYEDEY